MNYPAIDGELFSLGPLAIRWYGLAYLAAFVAAYWIGKRQARLIPGWGGQAVPDLIFAGALGVMLGGRIGYVFFYGWRRFLEDPLWLFQVWTGGMSFHGGLLGVTLAMMLFAYSNKRTLLQVADFTGPMVPAGLGFGRIANFINTELPGRVTDVPWGLHYPCAAVAELNKNCGVGYEAVARHPSPLYQAALEGVLLGVVLWWFARKPRPAGSVCGLFLAGYGAVRMFSETLRAPDAHIGFLPLHVTMGQVLSIPMLVAGLGLMWWGYRHDTTYASTAGTPQPVLEQTLPKDKRAKAKSKR